MCAKASLIRSTLLTNTNSALRAEDYSEIASQIVRISFTVPFWNWLFRLPLVNNRRLTARSEAITVSSTTSVCCLCVRWMCLCFIPKLCVSVYISPIIPQSQRDDPPNQRSHSAFFPSLLAVMRLIPSGHHSNTEQDGSLIEIGVPFG